MKKFIAIWLHRLANRIDTAILPVNEVHVHVDSGALGAQIAKIVKAEAAKRAARS